MRNHPINIELAQYQMQETASKACKKIVYRKKLANESVTKRYVGLRFFKIPELKSMPENGTHPMTDLALVKP